MVDLAFEAAVPWPIARGVLQQHFGHSRDHGPVAPPIWPHHEPAVLVKPPLLRVTKRVTNGQTARTSNIKYVVLISLLLDFV